jgi:hypothetical protein
MAIEIAGHRAGYEKTESGRRYRVRCSCGWPENVNGWSAGRTYATDHQATIEVLKHVTRAAKRAGLRPSTISPTGSASLDGTAPSGASG